MLWYEKKGNENDVFVSTRIRLARNIKDYPFGKLLSEKGAEEITEKVKSALPDYKFTNISTLAENEIDSLAEKHLISPEFADGAGESKNSTLAENEDGNVYIMLCEEDHIRIQSILPGFALDECLKSAFAADDAIDEKVTYAFDEKLGYITRCPTNLGCAMRASVMMFLPALTLTGGIKGIQSQLAKLGMTVRGVSGEGSVVKGSLYQFSNCVTMGISEEEIIKNIKEAVTKIAETERNLRKELRENAGDKIKDRVMRSYGIMKYANMYDTEELFRLYSDVRMGACMGYIDISPERLDTLLINSMRGTLCVNCGKDLSDRERDLLRAEKIRNEI